jgi:hypothetical protein
MSGLREAFDQIVADVPVYGDLDQAIEQADRERRHRYGVIAGLTAAAAVLAVVAGVVAVSHDTDAAPPISPSPTAVTPRPTVVKSQSPRTWADTPVAASHDGPDWRVPDPLTAVRKAWFSVVAGHLDPTGEHLEPIAGVNGATSFVWPADLPNYALYGRVELLVPLGDGSRLENRCPYLASHHSGNGRGSCEGESIAGPSGERAKVFRFERRCGAWEGGGPAPATCGDYAVAVTVERRDGLIGSVVVDGRGTLDYNPFTAEAMAAVAADPRLTLPEAALAVPSDRAVASVLAEHVPGLRSRDETSSLPDYPGYAWASGRLGRLGFSVSVWPAGGTPRCGSRWLIGCVDRHVFGADDPTTVYVGTWDEEHWASYPKNSRADRRVFVYVGPRNTVVVWESGVVKADEEPLGAELDQRMIDLALDPRLQ